MSKELSHEIKIEDKKIKLIANYSGEQASASVAIELDVIEYLELLKEAIPGDGLPETVIDMLSAALLK